MATSYANWQRAGDGGLGDVLKEMRNDFDEATVRAPSILFIDEIDAIPAREGLTSRNRDWWVSVMAALLECLDGISGREGVVVIAACNSHGGLDPALVRAGRLDRIIEIKIPTSAELEGIFRYHLGQELAEEPLHALSIAAVGCTGADVARMVRIARRSARQQNRPLALADLFDSLVDEGDDFPAEMIRRAAVHEAGHAIAAISLDISEQVINSSATSSCARMLA